MPNLPVFSPLDPDARFGMATFQLRGNSKGSHLIVSSRGQGLQRQCRGIFLPRAWLCGIGKGVAGAHVGELEERLWIHHEEDF